MNPLNSIPLPKRIVAALLLLVTVAVHVRAQEQPAVVGAGVVYELPVGSLHTRFLGTTGGMLFAGSEVSSNLTWVGSFRYSKFTQLHTDALKKSVTVGQGTGARQFMLPLPKLTMDLTTAGLTAEAHWGMLRSDIVDVNGIVGFGFTHWVHNRGAYIDSLFVDDAAGGLPVKVAALAVPALRQEDWSGTMELGFEVTGTVVGPLRYAVGADYKLIVGELWQSLDLDMENVAGMQFVVLRVGLQASL